MSVQGNCTLPRTGCGHSEWEWDRGVVGGEETLDRVAIVVSSGVIASRPDRPDFFCRRRRFGEPESR
jgi:hypothetical protein